VSSNVYYTIPLTASNVALRHCPEEPVGIWPTPGQLAVIAASGMLLGLAHFLLSETFCLSEATLVAPLKYTTPVWGIVLGFAVFGAIPDAWMLLGSALVVSGGLLALRRG
jgi:drug/metabolite transporter (DMT)-like permease